MKHVKSRDNASTELAMMTLLREHGLAGWRRHTPIFGRPDFAWSRPKVALFVDGCFWHGCPTCARPTPKTNPEFWRARIERNRDRDAEVNHALLNQGWRVVRVWEHELKRDPDAAVQRVMASLHLFHPAVQYLKKEDTYVSTRRIPAR